MKVQSAKAKGKRLENLVRDRLLQAFSLDSSDIRIAIGSENGADIKLSPKAKTIFPFSIECKARSKMDTLYKFYAQASTHEPKLIPLLVLKADYKNPLVVLDLDYFITLIGNNIK